MANALIGFTGFVGQNLMRKRKFDAMFNSRNIEEARGKTFDEVVFCGARAEKWKANAQPHEDAKHIDSLTDVLSSVRARRFVLISTIDVYKSPADVTESSPVIEDGLHPYGLNRYRLEKFIADRFPDRLIARLPGLFGPGIKKNAIFDFLNGNQVEKLDHRWRFQFYDLAWLDRDLQRAKEEDLRILNLATMPVDLNEVHQCLFGSAFSNEVDPQKVSYDMRSRYDSLWGRTDGYLYGREQVLSALRAFAFSYLPQRAEGA